MVDRKISAFYFALLIACIVICGIDAKGGRGGGGGRSSGGSRSWGGSSSRSSGSSSWFSRPSSSPSYSRPSPSPSYSRPSPSYSSPSYSAPSHSAPSPSYGWNTHSAPSPSYGWNTNSRGSSSGSTHTNSPSYGWNVQNTGSSISGSTGSKPSYGWNVQNTGSSVGSAGSTASKNNIGWNVPSNSPVGPPPAYPGLQSRPVQSHSSPPAYSPSYHNPPAYSPSYSPGYYNSPSSYGGSSNVYRTNTYNTHSSYPSSGHYNTYSNPSGYGRTFGSTGLPGNTYISNNYYGNHRSGSSGFLTNSLFYGAGMLHGHSWGSHRSYHHHHHHSNDHNRRSEWNEDSDRRWRATTQAPYFANKVPGEDKILPASAVIGAATAFGLASLLPLNVPARKPLMYCNDTDLAQSQIRINNGFIYQCMNDTVEILCPSILNSTKLAAIESTTVTVAENITATESTTVAENITVTESTTVAESTTLDESTTVADNATDSESTSEQYATTTVAPSQICENRLMVCSDEEGSESIFCKNGTLYSKDNIFCNSTVIVNGTNANETLSILNCYMGELPDSKASFIPTTTQAPTTTTTTEKSLSLGARMHVFFLGILGRSDILEKKETTTAEPDIPQLSSSEETPWVPEALTIPPETTTTTTTTTEAPFKWMQKVRTRFDNGTDGFTLRDVPQEILDAQKMVNDISEALGSTTIQPNYVKVYLTESTTSASINTTEEISTTVEPAAETTTDGST